MSNARHKRHFGPNDADVLLDARYLPPRLRRSKHRGPYGGPVYRAAGRLMEEIDLVAEVLTGNRRHFWLKSRSTPGSSKPVGPQPDTYDAE